MAYSLLHNNIILLYSFLLVCLPTFHIPLSGLLLESRCSASLSCVCVYMGVLLHMEYVCVCVCDRAAGLCCVSKRCYVISVWLQCGALVALFSKLLVAHNVDWTDGPPCVSVNFHYKRDKHEVVFLNSLTLVNQIS